MYEQLWELSYQLDILSCVSFLTLSAYVCYRWGLNKNKSVLTLLHALVFVVFVLLDWGVLTDLSPDVWAVLWGSYWWSYLAAVLIFVKGLIIFKLGLAASVFVLVGNPALNYLSLTTLLSLIEGKFYYLWFPSVILQVVGLWYGCGIHRASSRRDGNNNINNRFYSN